MAVFNALRNLETLFSTHPLTRDAPAKAWVRFASWQIRSRFQDEIIVPWVGGQKLAVRRKMTGATGNIYVGLHEFADMMLVLHVLRPGDLFLDIGANIGSFTILASGVCGARSWAFEPDPDTVIALERNIEINDLSDRVTVHAVALGDADRPIAITRGLDTVNRVASENDTDVRSVPGRRLDSLINDGQPLMIKMDVEGYEETVLRGAQHLLDQSGLKVIELETITEGIGAMLTQRGFRRAFYDPFRRALDAEPRDVRASNSVFVRDWDFVSERVATASGINIFGRQV